MPMSSDEFSKLREELSQLRSFIMGSKGYEYARGDVEDNRLANFEAVGAVLGVAPHVATALYLQKHIDSIMKAVRTGEAGSEPLIARFADAMNYLELLYACMRVHSPAGHQYGTP